MSFRGVSTRNEQKGEGGREDRGIAEGEEDGSKRRSIRTI